MPRFGWVAFALVYLTLAAATSAQAERRIALLISNEAYATEIGRLTNPHNDVALLEQSLKGLGFEVVTTRDAGLGALTRAINAHARRVQAAGSGAVGFFYYSGHGASDGTTNYLIPVDVKTSEIGELWDQSLRLTEITGKLKVEAGNATHFVVFDACRNTLRQTQPGSRAIVQSKGFIPVAQETGMLIAYATAEGELASDVGSTAGPYARVLAEEIVKPGIEAVVMFRSVQRRVRTAIRQEPYLGFNALGDVYFAGKGDLPTAAPTQQSGLSTAAPAEPLTCKWWQVEEPGTCVAKKPDQAKIRALATKQKIPVPSELVFTLPKSTTPVNFAAYVGAWGGEARWNGTGRQIMAIVTNVESSGTAAGFYAQGPPNANTINQAPATFVPFHGSINDTGLTFSLFGCCDYYFKIAPGDLYMAGKIINPTNGKGNSSIGLQRIGQ